MASRSEIDSLAEAALRLEPKSRANLTHRLVDSLDGLSRSELEAIWLDEAQRRDEDLESGAVTAIPGDEVLANIEARYGRATDSAGGRVHRVGPG